MLHEPELKDARSVNASFSEQCIGLAQALNAQPESHVNGLFRPMSTNEGLCSNSPMCGQDIGI